MRSHRRTGPIDHVLIAGGVEDLAGIQALVALLAPECYGQILIEAPAEPALPDLRTPSRVLVHRVEPTAVDGAALVAAVDAWVAEWLPGESSVERSVTMWIGGRASAHVNANCHHLGDLVERL